MCLLRVNIARQKINIESRNLGDGRRLPIHMKLILRTKGFPCPSQLKRLALIDHTCNFKETVVFVVDNEKKK